MAVKRFCLVPPCWTLEDYALHACSDHSHGHLSRAQIYDYDKHRSVKRIRANSSNKSWAL
jgi:hypothetical protein